MFVRVFQLQTDEQSRIKDTEVGRITWNGKGFSIHPEIPLLRNILAQPISIPAGVSPQELTAKDGEDFLRAMSYQYRSAYLRVTDPEDE
jgi:hypothetical protein